MARSNAAAQYIIVLNIAADGKLLAAHNLEAPLFVECIGAVIQFPCPQPDRSITASTGFFNADFHQSITYTTAIVAFAQVKPFKLDGGRIANAFRWDCGMRVNVAGRIGVNLCNKGELYLSDTNWLIELPCAVAGYCTK